MKATILERIQRLMETDDESPEKQSERLVHLYEASSDAQKQALDEALVCICGYGLGTLIRGEDEAET
jgi:hypothetical protein